jgi:putative SOS response-associated peptidase YedK
MCGRLNIVASDINAQVAKGLGIDFCAQQNLDLRPTQWVSALVMDKDGIQQQDARWGIQPDWSKTLLFNAKAETASSKKTFAFAFDQNRCLVPCSGWFEWRDEGGKRKQKYLFSHAQGEPLYMAGMLFPSDEGCQLVTLTTLATQDCQAYHHRMPLLIDASEIPYWLRNEPNQLTHLLKNNPDNPIRIAAV